MAFTLVSVSRLDKAGYKLEVGNGKCYIRSPKAKIIGIIPLKHRLYRVTDKRHQSANTILFANVATSSKRVTITQLHKIFAHANHDYLRKMVKNRMITGYELDENSVPEFCKPCIEAKMPRKLFPKVSTAPKAETYGEKVVCDL